MLEHSLNIIKEIWKIIGCRLGGIFLYLFIATHVTASFPVLIITYIAVLYGILRLTQDVLNKEVPWCKYKLKKHSFHPVVRYQLRKNKYFDNFAHSVICNNCSYVIAKKIKR